VIAYWTTLTEIAILTKGYFKSQWTCGQPKKCHSA
jgi:hypothetical protein